LSNADRPLAEQLRTTSLDAVIGQAHLLGADGPLGCARRAGPLVFGAAMMTRGALCPLMSRQHIPMRRSA
jgi:replication-associated recombination protein RarA